MSLAYNSGLSKLTKINFRSKIVNMMSGEKRVCIKKVSVSSSS